MNIGIYQGYWGKVGGGQRYIGVVAAILSHAYKVEIVHHCSKLDVSHLEEAMELDLSKVRFRYISRKERSAKKVNNPLNRLHEEAQWYKEISEPYDLFIDSSDCIPFFCHAKRGVLITHFPLITFDEFHGHVSEDWKKQPLIGKLTKNLFHKLEWKRRFATYDLCIANSHYTKFWLKQLWGCDAEVVYPPLRNGLYSQEKKNLILSICAFDNSEHKKHEIAIEAFKKLYRLGFSDWKYVIVGACDFSQENQTYITTLRSKSLGYPIEIRTNVTGNELRSLLGQASLLWHSMGYGVDEQREPRLMEHFGMVVTEAMATGCIPIVFKGGGLPEIVSHGQNGYLWSNPDELLKYSLLTIENSMLRFHLNERAAEASKRFSQANFESRLLKLLDPLLN